MYEGFCDSHIKYEKAFSVIVTDVNCLALEAALRLSRQLSRVPSSGKDDLWMSHCEVGGKAVISCDILS